jgi:cation diffusion facilitator family transporter
VLAAFCGNLFIALIKFLVAVVTRSSAMLAEAIHSLADTLNQVLLLTGMRLARRKADDLHPFGFSGETYFWSFIVAVFLFTVGAVFSVFEGIHKLMHPEPLRQVHWAFLVLGVSVLAEAFSFRLAYRKVKTEKGRLGLFAYLKRCKRAELIVVFMEDLAALTGLAMAILLLTAQYLTGYPYFDGLASILIGCLLAVVALFVGHEMKSLIIGESADPALLRQVMHSLRQEESVERVIHIRSLQMGPDDVLLAIKVEFNNRLNAQQIANLINAFESDIRRRHSEIKRIFIEPDIYRDPRPGH